MSVYYCARDCASLIGPSLSPSSPSQSPTTDEQPPLIPPFLLGSELFSLRCIILWKACCTRSSSPPRSLRPRCLEPQTRLCTAPRAPPPSFALTFILCRAVFSLIIINKAGGLIYQREFQAGLRKLSTNDYLVLAGTFHGVHAITRSITPKMPLAPTASSPAASSPSTSTPVSSGYAYPNPGVAATGIEELETDKFRLTCFQTMTGTKFLLFTDPMSGNVDVIINKIYELYADYVMKNPFYQLEMPVRCEAFDRHLGAWLRGRT